MHLVGAVGATIVFVGGFRLSDCRPPSPFAAGNSGPFAYTQGDEYVLPAVWISVLYFVAGIIAFFWISRNDRTGALSTWSSANLMLALLMSFMNWLSTFLQDDGDLLCGRRIVIALLFFALPYVVAVAANLGVMKYRPRGFPRH